MIAERKAHDPMPAGLRGVVVLAALASGARLLAPLAGGYPLVAADTAWLEIAISLGSLAFGWAALNRKSWGFWGLLLLVSAQAAFGLLVYLTGGGGDLLPAAFFAALGLALLSNRRWYARLREQSEAS